MKTKSLTQLSRELGVSVSYLSQVRHGKRQLSERVAKALCHMQQNDIKLINIAKQLNDLSNFSTISGGVTSAVRHPDAGINVKIAALCRGSTKDFESFYPGSIPGAAANNILIAL